MLENALDHIAEPDDESGCIVSGNGVGGIYPVRLLQPLNKVINIPYVFVACDVSIALNNPAGMLLRLVQPLNVPLNI